LDQNLFEKSEIFVKVASSFSEIQDRIPHKLSWPVKGALTTAIGFDHRVGEGGNIPQAGDIASASDGVNWFMLQKQKGLVSSHGVLDT